MRILRLEMENFRSFKDGPHVLALNEFQHGLHFVTGDNHVDTELGANGAGKSSVFDAINFALFGKTLQGLTAASVVSWGETECAVRVSISRHLEKYDIERGRKGRTNFLRLNGKEATQDVIDDAIGLNESLFAQALVRKQFAVMFFDRSPAEQLKLLTDVLDLEFWDEKSTAAKAQAKELADAARTAESEINRKEGAREAALASAAAAQASFDDAKTKHDADITAAQEVVNARETATNAAKWHLESCVNKHRALLAAVSGGDADVEKAKAAREQAASIAQQCRETTANHLSIKGQWSNRIEYFKSLSSGSCPTCEQAIAAEHVGACVSVAETEMEKLDAEIAFNGVKQKDIDEKVAKLDAYISAADAERQAQNEKVDAASKASDVARDNLRTAERESDSSKQSLSVLNAWTNPHANTLERETNEAKSLAEQIKTDTAGLREIQRAQSMVEFWVDGFRRIRLFVIDRAVSTLEVEVNSSLTSLGLSGYRIHFATERVNKSGGVSRKFDVMVDCPAIGKESVPLAAWSGGEYQRLRLACELGVSNMILKARGIDAEFEVWDEPTTHLSTEGITSLMTALRERAHALKRAIFLIDHTAHAFAFDSVTRVVKTSDGSRFESAGETK